MDIVLLKLKMAKSKLQKNKCWEWTGSLTNQGYGQLEVSGVTFKAHRLSWLLFNGGRLITLGVLHKCDNRKCINPDHLFLGTNADNLADRQAKGRQARGESHARSKLTMKDIRRIRKLVANGTRQSVLAKEYGVNFSTIFNIIKRKTWKHI